MSLRRAPGLPAAARVRAPADRHYRRPAAPVSRRRGGPRWWQVGRLVVLVVLAAGSAFWLGQRVLGSGLLTVDRIVVRGTERLSATDVEGLLDGLRGQHILGVDFDEYRRRVLESPWVERVTLWRLLPSTVEVTVVERAPLALARLDDQLYLVDHAGVIIDGFGPAHADLDVPIVDGLMRRPAERGAIVDLDRIGLTARFLAALEPRPDLLRRLSLIDVTNGSDLVALLGADPVLLHLGDAEFVQRLDKYLSLAPTLRERFDGLEYVDLRFGERVPVRAAGRVDDGPAGRRR
ncbi:MAG TPA: FtsQ-type POTRA domain-containing protein [Vicinamibacterales bacterium]|nr:FtsQ-type POTRA domain-containing protein [Vicinamibacterales bacterium]